MDDFDIYGDLDVLDHKEENEKVHYKNNALYLYRKQFLMIMFDDKILKICLKFFSSRWKSKISTNN
jgi:hypothetical protein